MTRLDSAESLILLLASSALKGTLVLAVAWLASLLLRSRPAAERHAIWGAALISIVVLPFASLLLPAWTTPVQRAAAAIPWRLVPAVPAGIAGDAFQVDAGAAPDSGWTWPVVAIVVWAAGALLALAALAIGGLRLRVLEQSSRLVTDGTCVEECRRLERWHGIERPVLLLESSRSKVPVTWGIRRPCVLLPEESRNWPADKVSAVLSHELAHIRRHDWPLNLLTEIARALYWFHPLVWLACRKVREEGELCCDDAVLEQGVDAADYAEHLLHVARSLGEKREPRRLSLAMARRSHLERRLIAMLLETRKRPAASPRRLILTTVGALALLLPLAALYSPAQSPASLGGNILDASGAAVPNATVIVLNSEADSRDMTTSGADGKFLFADLPSGTYDVEVQKEGFALMRVSGLALTPGKSVFQDFTLNVGRIRESLTVTAEGVPRSSDPAAAEPSKVRIGGSVQRAKLAKMVPPAYPTVAKSAGIQGVVTLEALVGVDGRLKSLRVQNSQIDPDLARSAVEAVSQWVYQPTLLNGEPVEVITQVDVNYTLTR